MHIDLDALNRRNGFRPRHQRFTPKQEFPAKAPPPKPASFR
jgi:hypothetical protein